MFVGSTAGCLLVIPLLVFLVTFLGDTLCWHLTLRAAPLTAAWYGRLVGADRPETPKHPTDLVAALRAPVIGLYGAEDTGIPLDTVDSMREKLAAEMGLTIHERRITRDEVYIADEAFFTGTAAEVLPIRELDGRVIGSGKWGPITEQLQSAYFDQVRGKRQSFPEWHSPVPCGGN